MGLDAQKRVSFELESEMGGLFSYLGSGIIIFQLKLLGTFSRCRDTLLTTYRWGVACAECNYLIMRT